MPSCPLWQLCFALLHQTPASANHEWQWQKLMELLLVSLHLSSPSSLCRRYTLGPCPPAATWNDVSSVRSWLQHWRPQLQKCDKSNALCSYWHPPVLAPWPHSSQFCRGSFSLSLPWSSPPWCMCERAHLLVPLLEWTSAAPPRMRWLKMWSTCTLTDTASRKCNSGSLLQLLAKLGDNCSGNCTKPRG